MRFIGVITTCLMFLIPTLRAQSWHSDDSSATVDDTATVPDSNDFYVKRDSLYAALRDSILVPEGLPEVIAKHYVTMCEGVYANAQEDYRHAESLFHALCLAEPKHPIGPLMHAATLNVEMVDDEVYRRADWCW